jgi:hypothetical protein
VIKGTNGQFESIDEFESGDAFMGNSENIDILNLQGSSNLNKENFDRESVVSKKRDT